MDNILVCGSCGTRMRIKPATLKVVKEVRCVKCREAVPVPDDMRKAAQNGTLQQPEAAAKSKSQPASSKHRSVTVKHTSVKGSVRRKASLQSKSSASAPTRSNANKPVDASKPSAPTHPEVNIKPIGESMTSSKSVRKPVVITRKRVGLKQIPLDEPVNNSKPMRPKTIVSLPPSSAPVTVAPAHGGADISSATVKLIPSSDGKSGAAASANKTKGAASKRPVRLEAAASVAAVQAAGADLSPVLKKVVADIEALGTRLAKLEVASLEDRVASLEKMSVSMTALQQRSSDELNDLSERIAELRRTVSGIDNRVACMLKASLEHSMGLTASLENI